MAKLKPIKSKWIRYSKNVIPKEWVKSGYFKDVNQLIAWHDSYPADPQSN